MLTRILGDSGVEVSGLGMGCWAIGGPWSRYDGEPLGWGQTDDAESLRALSRALDLGVTLFDTADVYGCGHSERLLGQALKGRRDQVVIATKFGKVFDEATRVMSGEDMSPEYARRACEASLKRLQTGWIDITQLHWSVCPVDQALALRQALEELVQEGKIRFYAWSTDDPERVRAFAGGAAHCISVQHNENLFEHNAEMIALCEELGLASINRGPLAMGLLTGKFNAGSRIDADDTRHGWDFRQGTIAERINLLEKLRDILTQDGRTLAQGALGWLWAISQRTIPIPGFKTVQQVEENAGALRFGALNADAMQQIEGLLGRL